MAFTDEELDLLTDARADLELAQRGYNPDGERISDPMRHKLVEDAKESLKEIDV